MRHFVCALKRNVESSAGRSRLAKGDSSSRRLMLEDQRYSARGRAGKVLRTYGSSILDKQLLLSRRKRASYGPILYLPLHALDVSPIRDIARCRWCTTWRTLSALTDSSTLAMGFAKGFSAVTLPLRARILRNPPASEELHYPSVGAIELNAVWCIFNASSNQFAKRSPHSKCPLHPCATDCPTLVISLLTTKTFSNQTRCVKCAYRSC